MESFARSRFVAWMLAILLTTPTLTAMAEEPSPEAIDVRWVMAGMTGKNDGALPVTVPPNARLRTGDKLKMYLKTRHPCYFYLFHQGPDSRLTLLYPPSLPTKALSGGTHMTIPKDGRWFELDEQTGTETFHVLVSATPLDAIETLYSEYQKQGTENNTAYVRLLAAIERLQRKQRPLTSKAERPISIGGTIRGAGTKDKASEQSRLDRLAEDIAATNVFCRTYTIEHH